MEFTGQAFEEMQDQNIRVLQELREKEEANLKLMSEVRELLYGIRVNRCISPSDLNAQRLILIRRKDLLRTWKFVCEINRKET